MHRALIDAAFELFDRHGYDNVTTEQIADAAGFTQRTFFRHFESKAAVVFAEPEQDPQAALDWFSNRLHQQPRHVSYNDALLAVIAEDQVRQPAGERELVRVRVITGAPSLMEHARRFETDFEQVLVTWIGNRSGRGADDLDVRTLAAVYVAARRVAIGEWQRTGGTEPIIDIAHRVLETVTPSL